ncbi:MAG: hypothetical protein QOF85_770 [Solirubrobacterales bacterium]|nr:hypothetical protein [Solirubrobacterales bacterium]
MVFSPSRLSPSRRNAAAFVAFLAMLSLVLPATTSAATNQYPPGGAARGFSGGPAGWTSSSATEGNCLAPLLCASVENSYQGAGGADGGGFVRSAYTGAVGATAVGGTTTGTWESPPFTYAGTGGGKATAVSFALDRRASVDKLLAVEGNSAEYTVRLIDASDGGEALTLIPATTLAGAHSWTNVSRGSIDPESLTSGHDYRIQIMSSYTTGTSALVTGSADYDNVVLAASDGTSGKGKGGKGNGGGALNEQRLEDLLRQATPGTAVLNGRRLFVRVNCPRKIGHACRTTAQGLLRKNRPATGKRTVHLRSGKSRLVVLKVKPKARKQMAKRKRLLVRQKVRAGKVTATVVKNRRLIRR